MTDAPQIAVITVSYTARMDYVARQSTALAQEAAVREWIVVANGNGDLVRSAALTFQRSPQIVVLDSNVGSAIGFGSGISAALVNPDNRYFLLLDEDNLPEAGAVARLLEAFRSEPARPNLAIAAYRHRAHAAQAHGIDIRRPDSSIGFHVADLPGKLVRRLTRPALKLRRPSIRTSAYGGLFVPRSIVESVGLPLPQFVLYGDDTEFTLRMTDTGTTIVLETDIRVIDMNTPPAPEPVIFSFVGWLSVADDFRLYYGARNEAWLDRHRFARHVAVYHFNRAFVRLVLRLYARTGEQRRRLALFLRAAAEGEAGHLGLHPNYPLPKAQP